jgi:arsenate reductase (thioredoxin)
MFRILFLCVENSARSQMAEAFARIHGAGLVEAWSAGSRPAGRLDPRVVEAMRGRGYDMGSHRSKGPAETGPGRWDWAVTMGCGDECPWVEAAHREDWSLPDPRAMTCEELDALRDEIEMRVLDLLARLRSDQPTPGSGDCC